MDREFWAYLSRVRYGWVERNRFSLCDGGLPFLNRPFNSSPKSARHGLPHLLIRRCRRLPRGLRLGSTRLFRSSPPSTAPIRLRLIPSFTGLLSPAPPRQTPKPSPSHAGIPLPPPRRLSPAPLRSPLAGRCRYDLCGRRTGEALRVRPRRSDGHPDACAHPPPEAASGAVLSAARVAVGGPPACRRSHLPN